MTAIPSPPSMVPDPAIKGIYFENPKSCEGSSVRAAQNLKPAAAVEQVLDDPFLPPSPPSGTRPRTAQACDKCRQRKTKCSGEHPTCMRCMSRGLVCHYSARMPRARNSTQNISRSQIPIKAMSDSSLTSSTAVDQGVLGPQRKSGTRLSGSSHIFRPYPSLDSRRTFNTTPTDFDRRPSSSPGEYRGVNTRQKDGGYPTISPPQVPYSQQLATLPPSTRAGEEYPRHRCGQTETSGVAYACCQRYAPPIRSAGNQGRASPLYEGGSDIVRPRATAPLHSNLFGSGSHGAPDAMNCPGEKGANYMQPMFAYNQNSYTNMASAVLNARVPGLTSNNDLHYNSPFASHSSPTSPPSSNLAYPN